MTMKLHPLADISPAVYVPSKWHAFDIAANGFAGRLTTIPMDALTDDVSAVAYDLRGRHVWMALYSTAGFGNFRVWRAAPAAPAPANVLDPYNIGTNSISMVFPVEVGAVDNLQVWATAGTAPHRFVIYWVP